MSAALLTGAAVSVTVMAALRGTWSPCGLSMISSMNPMAERSRGHRFSFTAAWFFGGSLLGGALLGAGCAALAAVLGPIVSTGTTPVVVAVIGCLIAVAGDLHIGGFALPHHPRQVDERWLHSYRRWVYAGGFGLQIGSGFATYIMTAATYLVVLLSALTGSESIGLGCGVVFGAVRGAVMILGAAARTPEALMRIQRRLAAWAPLSAAGAVGVSTVAALVLAMSSARIGLVLVAVLSLVVFAGWTLLGRSQGTGAFHSNGSISRRTLRRRFRGRWSM